MPPAVNARRRPLYPRARRLRGIIVKQKIPFLRNFNWRIFLLRILINAAALLLTALLVPSIYFVDRTLISLLLMALALGLLNALVKPIIQLLTLRFIFASYGLIVILINAFMLWLLSYFFPERFAVDKLFWAFVGGAIIGLAGSLLESLLGVTPPVVGDKYPDLRTKVKEKQPPGIGTLLVQPISDSAPDLAAQGPEADAAEVAETPPEPGSDDARAQIVAGGEA
jgi:putative membrane protein